MFGEYRHIMLPVFLLHKSSTIFSSQFSGTAAAMILLIGVNGTGMDVKSIFASLLQKVTKAGEWKRR